MQRVARSRIQLALDSIRRQVRRGRQSEKSISQQEYVLTRERTMAGRVMQQWRRQCFMSRCYHQIETTSQHTLVRHCLSVWGQKVAVRLNDNTRYADILERAALITKARYFR